MLSERAPSTAQADHSSETSEMSTSARKRQKWRRLMIADSASRSQSRSTRAPASAAGDGCAHANISHSTRPAVPVREKGGGWGWGALAGERTFRVQHARELAGTATRLFRVVGKVQFCHVVGGQSLEEVDSVRAKQLDEAAIQTGHAWRPRPLVQRHAAGVVPQHGACAQLYRCGATGCPQHLGSVAGPGM